jgi:hypothetical protein
LRIVTIIVVIAAVVVAAVVVFLATRPVVPTRSATAADIPAIVAKLATLKDGSFAVFMFHSPLSSGGDAVNLQYSVEHGAVGLDWVLLGQTNIADKEKVSAFASQLGHPMTERVMNDVHYLRTEGRDLDKVGTSIIVELYGIPHSATVELITEGFEWPPKT